MHSFVRSQHTEPPGRPGGAAGVHSSPQGSPIGVLQLQPATIAIVPPRIRSASARRKVPARGAVLRAWPDARASTTERRDRDRTKKSARTSAEAIAASGPLERAGLVTRQPHAPPPAGFGMPRMSGRLARETL